MINPLMVFRGYRKLTNFVFELSKEGVGAIIVESCESTLSEYLETKEIKIIDGMHGSARNAVQEFKELVIMRLHDSTGGGVARSCHERLAFNVAMTVATKW